MWAFGSLDNVVGIQNRLRIGRYEDRIPAGAMDLFSKSFRPALGLTQRPDQWVPGAVSPGVKQAVREASH